jgi:hypothetical protein
MMRARPCLSALRTDKARSPVIGVLLGHPRATHATPEQARKDALRPNAIPRPLQRSFGASALSCLEDLVIDNAEVRQHTALPFGFRLGAPDPGACVRIAKRAGSIPGYPTAVELILQNASAALRVPTDR